MANVTIPDLTALSANVADGDLLEIADISNANASRRVTRLEIIGLGSTGITTLGTITTGTWTGTTIAVANGGTGLTSGTSGGVLAFTASGTLASSGALAANALVIGGGAGVAPSTTTTGTGVVTALGVNVGSAGAFVVNGGAGGTPSSLTLTNATGLPIGSLADSAAGADRILFWDQSATNWVELTVGSGLNITGTTITATGSGTGDVVGPASSTDNAIVLWDGATGELIQDSVVIVDPLTGDMTGVGDITGDSVAVTTLTVGGVTATGVTGTGDIVFNNAPTLVEAVASTTFSPSSNDGAALGTTALGWADLHFATGATINVANGNAVITHSSGIFTVSTGDLRVTTAGTNAASVVTVGGTQSLTNKKLGSLTSNGLVTTSSGDGTLSVTAPGTGVLTALGVNVGSAGAFVTFNGALGTPSSGTLTNATGLPASGIAAGVLGGNITLGESTGQIILDPTLSADGTWSGIMMAGTAGATLAFGDLVYLAAADSRWELADADAASTSGTVILGMCVLAAAADGDPTNILLFGKIRADAAFPALTIGGAVYVGTTAGDVQTTAPNGTDDVIRVVGFAQTADVLIFNPSPHYFTSV